MLMQFRLFLLLLENSHFHIQRAREINTALIDFSRKNVQYGVSTFLIFHFLNGMVLRKPQGARENTGSCFVILCEPQGSLEWRVSLQSPTCAL